MTDPNRDNEILRFYEAEMRYLREASKEFARDFPERARALNLNGVGERDPKVERLFEGFAFLMGRLRQKLDDDLPELTEGVVSMLWPYYQRMIPSLSILELTPNADVVQACATVPAGQEVMSDPIDCGADDRVECVYRTTQPVDLYPLRIAEAGAYVREDGRQVIRLRFAITPQARRAALTVPRLRLYLHAERPVALALHCALTAKPIALDVSVPGYPADRPGQPLAMRGLKLEGAGFSDDERLWPNPDPAFGGRQLLLEYFTFPEKFMFLDLLGLDLGVLPADAPFFDVEVVLARLLPAGVQVSTDNVRLYCTPVINLFPLEVAPIVVNAHEAEYRVRAAPRHGRYAEAYSVDSVQGFETDGGERFSYKPFAAFRHRGGMLRHEMPERYFHTRLQRGPSGRLETWIVLGGSVWEGEEVPQGEKLSLSVTGTNGMLPRKALGEASIRRIRSGIASVSAVRNLIAPSMPVYPPTGSHFHWRLLSHLAPNYLSMLDTETLRGSLALYDWTDGDRNRRRIEAITDLRHRPLQKLERHGLLRGVELSVMLDTTCFEGPGDVEMFGNMLSRFLSLYATPRLYTQLVVVMQPSGECRAWPEIKGEGPPF